MAVVESKVFFGGRAVARWAGWKKSGLARVGGPKIVTVCIRVFRRVYIVLRRPSFPGGRPKSRLIVSVMTFRCFLLLSAAGLEVIDRRGLAYDPARGFKLSADLALDYFVTARHAGL